MSEDGEGINVTNVLGLTGGIASGKSTVSEYIRKLGFPVIDADEIAKEIMKTDEPTYSKVVAFFGEEIINEDRSINRQRLGDIVFNDEDKLLQLNALVQKDIFKEIMNKKTHYSNGDYSLIVMDVPLLFETGYDKYVDEVMVVYVDYATQLERLQKRDQLTKGEAVNRIKAQESLETKKKKADILIDNSGTIEETICQVDDWLTINGYSSPK